MKNKWIITLLDKYCIVCYNGLKAKDKWPRPFLVISLSTVIISLEVIGNWNISEMESFQIKSTYGAQLGGGRGGVKLPSLGGAP